MTKLSFTPWLDVLRADFVYGWRQLKKNKMTSAAAVLSLALAIGACLSAFRLIDALLLRPLPVADPERLYAVAFHGSHGIPNTWDACTYPMFRDMRTLVKDQAELIAVSYADRTDLTYGSDEEMEKAYQQFVSGWMFGSFGLRPALGRLLTESDDVTPGAHPYAVISYDYWTRRFGQDPKAIGRRFRMGNDSFEIVGVAGEGFTGTETGTLTDVFIPMAMKNPRTRESTENYWLRTLVRLKPGVTAEPLREKLTTVFQQTQAERVKNVRPGSRQKVDQILEEKLLLEPAAAGRSNLQRDYGRSLTILAVLVALVLLIACANLANLMTAQAAARAREMALRISIGAGRWRLVQLILVESAWIAFLAALIGGLLAWSSAPLIVGMINPPDNPARLVLSMDWRVLGFALILTFGVTFLFGLIPALRVSAIQPVSVLKGGDPHSRRRLMHMLIAAQVAFCFVVHFTAGLFVSSFDRLSHQPLGFSAERVLNLETVTPSPQSTALWEQVAEHLRSVPGVENVALTGFPIMSGESAITGVWINGAPSETLSDVHNISPGWIDAMKAVLIDGRDFRASDFSPGAAIVNETFSKQYFNGENPVGKSFELPGGGAGKRVRFQIVGYIRDARSRDMRRVIRPTVYLPFQAVDATGAIQLRARGTFVIKTSTHNPTALASILRREVPHARAEFRVSNIRTQSELVLQHTLRERLLAMLALFFAGVALLLAGVGLYGILDYSAIQRRREIGIRMALGAQPANIAQRVTVEVFSMVLIGAVLGVVLGLGSQRYLESLLYQVKATDLAMLALPALTILGVAILAALSPVIRAIRIDPVAMLRTE